MSDAAAPTATANGSTATATAAGGGKVASELIISERWDKCLERCV